MSTPVQSSQQELSYYEPHPVVHCLPIVALAAVILGAYAQVHFMTHNLMSNFEHRLFVYGTYVAAAFGFTIYAITKCFYEYRQNQVTQSDNEDK